MKLLAVSCVACFAFLLLLGCGRPESSAIAVDSAHETSASQPDAPEDPGTTEGENGQADLPYINKGVSDGIVSVKEFGAVGDGEADDTDAIQTAISSGETIYFPAGNYKLSQPIMITGKSFWSLYAQDACFEYSGDDYAFKINEAVNCHIEIGEILAARGGGIEFYSEDLQHWNQYVSLTFNYIACATDCIYVRVAGGWCNENQVHGGRFAAGNNGVRVEFRGGDNPNGWKFYNCGIEGVDNGFLFDAGSGHIFTMAVINPRYAESFGTIFQTIGKVWDCLWIGTQVVEADMISCSADTTSFEILAPVGSIAGHRGCIVDGQLMAEQIVYKPVE